MALTSALDIVIVSYRCRELLRNCLEALAAHPPSRPFTVTVVDNDSNDGTVEMVAAEFPEVRVIASDRNLGFSAANNLGMRGRDSTYVLALNPDTRVTAGALDRLLELMDAKPEVGISGCRLEREDGTLDHAVARPFPTIAGSLAHFTGIGRRSATGPDGSSAPDPEPGPVDCLNGAFMLMRRSMLEEIGEWDEGFWMYMEDIDLCYRAVEGGFVVWYDPSVTVYHVKRAITGKHLAPRMNYSFHYGMYRFYRKHYAAKRSAFTNLAVYAGIAGKLGISLVRSALGRRRASRLARA